MAYNCKNPDGVKACGTFVVPYLENMGWIAKELLDIIYENIIVKADVTNNFLTPIGTSNFNDITGPDCKCTTGLETADAAIFNCATWEEIKIKLIDGSGTDPATATPAIIPLLCQVIDCFLKNTSEINYGLAAQLERFLCLAESLNTRLDSVCCNNKCPEIIGDLLCVLMQILTKLSSAVNKASTLLYYNNCVETADNRVIESFFECMACDFVNDLCELEKLLAEISAIVVGFATCDMQKCTPCYTAPSVPRKVRPMCPENMMPYGGGYNVGYPYQNKGGCGCKK